MPLLFTFLLFTGIRLLSIIYESSVEKINKRAITNSMFTFPLAQEWIYRRLETWTKLNIILRIKCLK